MSIDTEEPEADGKKLFEREIGANSESANHDLAPRVSKVFTVGSQDLAILIYLELAVHEVQEEEEGVESLEAKRLRIVAGLEAKTSLSLLGTHKPCSRLQLDV